jgi:hypothetical protein
METYLLREQEVIPTEEVLKEVLAESYAAYEDLMKTVSDSKYGLVPQWNYYKDGKAWLCKVCYKKKTIFWLSVWDKFFKTTCYFTEKDCSGITGLDIDENIKESFNNSKHIGKLIPLTIEIKNKQQVSDALKVIAYKKSLK